MRVDMNRFVFVVLVLLLGAGGLATVTSCHFSEASGDDNDTVKLNLIDSFTKLEQPVYLMDILDSLKRDLIYFPPMDSLNPISPREAKRNLRDSILYELKKKPKHVYLTFDDGPLIGSSAIESIATDKGVKINVFLVGRHARMSKRLEEDFQRYLSNPLVESYNHSYTHANHRYQSFYNNPDNAFADFEKAQAEMGLTHKVARLPGRNIWRFGDVSRSDGNSGMSTAEMLFNEGYKVFGWDVEWRINGRTGEPVQTVEQTYRSIVSFMSNNYALYPNNVVLLMHDDMFQNDKGQKLLIELIDKLQQHPDYHFEFMTDYPRKY